MAIEYEHRVVNLGSNIDIRTDRQLDLYGSAGWELVAVCSQQTRSGYTADHIAYFKRRKATPSPEKAG